MRKGLQKQYLACRLLHTRPDIKDGLAHEVEALPYDLQHTRLIGERGEGVVDFGVVAIQDIPGVLNRLGILFQEKYLSAKNQGREQAKAHPGRNRCSAQL